MSQMDFTTSTDVEITAVDATFASILAPSTKDSTDNIENVPHMPHDAVATETPTAIVGTPYKSIAHYAPGILSDFMPMGVLAAYALPRRNEVAELDNRAKIASMDIDDANANSHINAFSLPSINTLVDVNHVPYGISQHSVTQHSAHVAPITPVVPPHAHAMPKYVAPSSAPRYQWISYVIDNVQIGFSVPIEDLPKYMKNNPTSSHHPTAIDRARYHTPVQDYMAARKQRTEHLNRVLNSVAAPPLAPTTAAITVNAARAAAETSPVTSVAPITPVVQPSEPSAPTILNANPAIEPTASSVVQPSASSVAPPHATSSTIVNANPAIAQSVFRAKAIATVLAARARRDQSESSAVTVKTKKLKGQAPRDLHRGSHTDPTTPASTDDRPKFITPVMFDPAMFEKPKVGRPKMTSSQKSRKMK